MKRYSRNKVCRAYSKGYQKGLLGRSNESCPHFEKNKRQAWLAGWRDGWADHIEGYREIPGITGAEIICISGNHRYTTQGLASKLDKEASCISFIFPNKREIE